MLTYACSRCPVDAIIATEDREIFNAKLAQVPSVYSLYWYKSTNLLTLQAPAQIKESTAPGMSAEIPTLLAVTAHKYKY